jgi:hypothetical protein
MGRARGVITARSSRVRWHGGVFTGGSVVAGRRQGVVSELTWDKEGAGQDGQGWRSLGIAAFIGEEGAPVAMEVWPYSVGTEEGR